MSKQIKIRLGLFLFKDPTDFGNYPPTESQTIYGGYKSNSNNNNYNEIPASSRSTNIYSALDDRSAFVAPAAPVNHQQPASISPIRDKYAERLIKYGILQGDTNTTLYTSTLTSPTNIRSRQPLHGDKPILTSSSSISSTSDNLYSKKGIFIALFCFLRFCLLYNNHQIALLVIFLFLKIHTHSIRIVNRNRKLKDRLSFKSTIHL